MARPIRTALYALLAALMVDSLIQVGMIGGTVGFLHRDYPMNVRGPNGQTVILKGKPAGMMVNQGHTSNGAAGSALILVGLLGFLVLTQRPKLERVFPRLYRPLLTTWVVLSILCFLLTLAALAYTFTVTNQTSGQTIHLAGLSSPIRYPFDKWVPQTWYGTILKDLEFVNPHSHSVVIDGSSIPWATRSDVERMKHVTNGWKWNLIPLFLLQIVITPLIVVEYLAIIRGGRTAISQIDKEDA